MAPYEMTIDMGPAGTSRLYFDVQAEGEEAFNAAIEEALTVGSIISAELVAVATGEGDVILHSWTHPEYSPEFALIY